MHQANLTTKDTYKEAMAATTSNETISSMEATTRLYPTTTEETYRAIQVRVTMDIVGRLS